jgi:colanic acid biosynthesis glycosyl transferase WcaI
MCQIANSICEKPATQAGSGPMSSIRVAFVSCLFPPEPEPSSVMAHQLARELKARGHDVTMIVPYPNRPKGILYDGYKREFLGRYDVDGLRVVRCPTWLLGPERKAWNRILENLSFGVSAALTAALETRPSVLLLESWPLAAVQLSMWEARRRGVPVLYYVKDLYPETLENSGLIRRGGLVARALYRWDRKLCMASSKVIVISTSMRDALLDGRKLPPDRVAVIPDWIDDREFPLLPRDNGWRRDKGIPDASFVALFAGTLGLVSGADMLVEAAERLRHRPEIVFCCVGQGVLKDRMMSEAKARGLTNIRFEPLQIRERVPEMQAAADVCLLTMRPDSSNASVPSKLIAYMAAGRPVICAAPPQTDAAKTIRGARTGLVAPAGDPEAFAAAILYLHDRPQEAAAMGLRARRCFEENFALGNRCEQFVELFASAMRNSRNYSHAL